MDKKLLNSSVSLALQHGFLTQAKKIHELLLTSENKVQVNIDYATALMSAGYYTQAERFYSKALNFDSVDEWAKLGCAWSYIEQHKTGWVEILDELTVSSVDADVRSIIGMLYERVGNIFYNNHSLEN